MKGPPEQVDVRAAVVTDVVDPPVGAFPLVDSHLHVFGPPERYPLDAAAGYHPKTATRHDYDAMTSALNVSHVVLVQPSVYGDDHSCLLDAVEAFGPRRAAAVAMAPRAGVDVALIDELIGRGVRGLRLIGFPADAALHTNSTLVSISDDFVRDLRRQLDHAASLALDHHLHLDLLLPGGVLVTLLEQLREIPVDYTVAHLGLVAPRASGRQFDALAELLTSGKRRCWAKLTGPYRLAGVDGFAGVRDLTRTLLELAPDRIIWGSDFPHAQFSDRYRTIDVATMTMGWIEAPVHRRMVGWSNACTLYGFDPASAADIDETDDRSRIESCDQN